MTTSLLSPVSLGALHLPNRFVMAPLTRTRTGEARVPGDLNAGGVLSYLGAELDRRSLAYAHYIEPVVEGERQVGLTETLRHTWHGPLVLAQGFTPETAEAAVSQGRADAIAFGRAFISSPDLPERHRVGAELVEADASTFYGEGPQGYTDYPTLPDAA